MLIPKLRVCTTVIDGQEYCGNKYAVWDTDECEYIEKRSLGVYDTYAECQEAIDFFNKLEVVKVS